MYAVYYTRKYRIYPTEEQAARIDHTAIVCKQVYSLALQDMIEHHKATGEIITPKVMDYRLNHHINAKDVDPLALSKTLLSLEKDFKRKVAENEYPSPPPKRSSLSYSTSSKGFNIEDNRWAIIPHIGRVRIIVHRPLPCGQTLQGIAIKKLPWGEYDISLLYKKAGCPPNEADANEDNTLGLDFSVPKFYVDSNGDCPDHPRFYDAEQKKIEAIQRRMKRMKRGSRNYKKEALKLARLHGKIHNRRLDWLHKESHRLADAYDFIGVEDLDLRGIEQTYSLGPHTLDNGYGLFLALLAYKMRDRGKTLVRINRWIRSSQMCHKCKYINKELTLDTRFWICPKCGSRNSRDHNAATNIKNLVLEYKA